MSVSRIASLVWILVPLAACERAPEDPFPHLKIDSEVVRGDLGQDLDEYLTRCEVFGFSGAALVARRGEIVLHKGYGLANRSERIENSIETLHSVESITKPFTALAILRLQEEGKLSVDDRLDKWFARVPEQLRDITVAQLLSHTSGLPGEYEPSRDDLPPDQVAEEIFDLGIEVAPGGEWHYSNPGYVLLAILVELASGERYDGYVEQHILRVAGMTESGFIGGEQPVDRSRVAHAYNRDIDGGSPIDWVGGYAGYWGAGGLLATPRDLYRWLLALDGDLLVSTESKQLMFEPRVEVFDQWQYGFGIFWVATDRGTHFIRHGGNRTPAGVTAELRHYLEDEIVLILAVNSMIDDVGLSRAVRPGLLDLIFDIAPVWPPRTGSASADEMEALEGIYVLPEGDIEIGRDGDRLLARVGEQAVFDLLKGHTDEEKERIEVARRLSSEAATWTKVLEDPELPTSCRAVVAEALPGDLVTVFVDLDYPTGPKSQRWVWEGEEFVMALPTTVGPVVELHPIGDREWVAWDLIRATGSRLRFPARPGLELEIEVAYPGEATRRVSND